MLRIVTLVFVLLALAVPISGWWLAQSALPVLDGVIPLSALYRNVVIKFDNHAVPSIEAESDNDAYFAQGYITAAQRLFQMDMMRRTAKGELSQIFGSASLPHDRLMRTIGINRLSVQTEKTLPREVKETLSAYSRGVNAYIEQNQGRLSIPFALLGYKPQPWRNEDSLAILKYTQYQADESWQLDDLRQRILDKAGSKIAPQLFGASMIETPAKTVSYDDTKTDVNFSKKWNQLSESIAQTFLGGLKIPNSPMVGSNGWVVSGSLSDSKQPLLACDKHNMFTAPDFYYVCSITSPKLHMAGATIAGVPGIMLGRNEGIAFASTTFKADGQDLVLEQFSPQFPDRYKTPSNWLKVNEITEDIPVRFATVLLHKVLLTKDGPILSKADTDGVALAWASAKEKVSVYETLYRINRANNAKEFLAVIANYSGSPQSFIYADRSGINGFHVAGCVPLHGGETAKGYAALGAYGTTASPGWTSELHWPGKLSFDQLPHSESNQSFAIADPPYTLNDAAAYRYNRLNSLLSAAQKSNNKMDLVDMAYLQTDQVAPLADLVRKEVEKALSSQSVVDKFALSAEAVLSKWDGNLKADSVGASIYESFLQTMTRRILEPKIGLTATLEYMNKWPRSTVFTENVLRQKPLAMLPAQERTYETFIVTTFIEAIKNLRLSSHSDEPSHWSWQSVHNANFRNELLENVPIYKAIFSPLFAVPQVGLGGDSTTINACNIVTEPDPWMFTSNCGPTARMLFDMADSDKFYANLSLGQSEHILSSYRSDELANWLRAEPLVVAFSAAEADKQMQHKLILANH